MFTSRQTVRSRRRGAILLVTVVLLALFASIALSFVLFATSEADSSRINREAQTLEVVSTPPDPYENFNEALHQLIYGVPDSVPGNYSETPYLYSSLRGWDLARDMYGYTSFPFMGDTATVQDENGNPYTITKARNDTRPSANWNRTPFNGFGIPNYPITAGGAGASDNSLMVNFGFFPADIFIRHPERYNPNPGLSDPFGLPYVGKNAPYTYPDMTHMFLAAVDARGNLLTPSFHRDWIFGSLDPTNPNWTDPIGKYLTLRPRQADNSPEFPMPLQGVDANGNPVFGDVQNLPFDLADRRDSIWIDMGMPVRKWRGKEYKPLFAWLVLDLDGRVNLNTAGNQHGSAGESVSNQGWGTWGVNPEAILGGGPGSATPLFTGGGGVIGRYGRDLLPSNPDGMTALVRPGVAPPYYAQVDYDGDATGRPFFGPDGMGNSASPLSPFPFFPAGVGYDNGTAGERTHHASMYNPYFWQDAVPPAGRPGDAWYDRVFGVQQMRYLNAAFNGPDNLYADPDAHLAQLFPAQFGMDMPLGVTNPRFLMTTLSNDLDRAGAMPVTAAPTLAIDPMTGHLSAPAADDPADLNDPRTGRSLIPLNIPGVDLNRTLTDYRLNADDGMGNPQPLSSTNIKQGAELTEVNNERTAFAQEIYNALRLLTGEPADPSVLRYLGQLAVNVVDFIDADDVMTSLSEDGFTVWGVEQPRLVLNEAYCQINNDPEDPLEEDAAMVRSAALPYHVNFWVELHNPGRNDPATSVYPLADQGAVRLWDPQGFAVYRVVVTRPDVAQRYWPDPNNPANPPQLSPWEDPTLEGGGEAVLTQTLDYTESTAPTLAGEEQFLVRPQNDGNTYAGVDQGNAGFFVLGPTQEYFDTHDATGDPTTGDDGRTRASLKMNTPDPMNATPAGPDRNGMMYVFSPTMDGEPSPILPADLPQHDILLRRLANPYAPPDPNTNPYILVDTLVNVETQDAIRADNDKIRDMDGERPVPVDERSAFGRIHPFAAREQFVLGWETDQPEDQPMGEPRHTFFRHNGMAAARQDGDSHLIQPFPGFVHKDRQLVSPLELLHVGGFGPERFTREYANDDPNMMGSPQFNRHVAPWTDQQSRLYRALGVLRTGSRVAGLGPNGRVPGKININTVWDREVFQALIDPQGANGFTQPEVDALWESFVASRTPTMDPNVSPTPAITEQDRPFFDFITPVFDGSGTYPEHFGDDPTFALNGLDATLLRRIDPIDPTSPRVFTSPSATNAYDEEEILRKISNSTTNRSNVFVVYCTIGYFEVVDYDQANGGRPRLGAEIDAAERHKFFAVVDRSNLSVDPADPMRQGPKPVFFDRELPADTSMPQDGTLIAVPCFEGDDGVYLNGFYEEARWTLQPGTPLFVNGSSDPAAIRTVTSVIFNGPGMGFITLDSAAPPGSSLCITTIGNPGPQKDFKYHDDPYTAVVRYVERLR